MTTMLAKLTAEALATGTIAGLPGGHLIGGSTVPANGENILETIDPGSERVIAKVPAGSAGDIDRAVEAADRAFRAVWRRTKPAVRTRILLNVAQLIRDNADRLAVVDALDSGKTLAESQWDVASSARFFEYYAGAADKLQGDQIPLGPDYVSYTLLEPVGVTAHIIPWNYPTSTMARGLAPALAAGCTAVVKPAEQTPLTALMIGEILLKAGLPEGVVNVVTGTGPDAGAPLVAHPKVRHVTFTGSVETGTLVMQAAARNITSVTLELGGKSPVVALADCDVEAAAEGTRWAFCSNAGQVCSAGSRLVVERGVHDELVDRVAGKVSQLRVGHGLRGPDIGAINSVDQLDKVAGYVDGARTRGIPVVTGGNRTRDSESGRGWFFEPTILDRAPAEDAVVQEEIFGPVLTVQVVDSAEEALTIGNGTRFGLAAGIYTRDITKALRLARDLDAGQIYVNEYYAGGVETPFGGMKSSGFGREKGLEALRAYTSVKSVTARI